MCSLFECEVYQKALPYREELIKLNKLRDATVWHYEHTDRITWLIAAMIEIEQEICQREIKERKEYSAKKRAFLARMEEAFSMEPDNAQHA